MYLIISFGVLASQPHCNELASAAVANLPPAGRLESDEEERR